MRQQQATTVVPLPLAAVETRLRDVESWSQFLLGIESIKFTSFERYLFTLADGRDHREIKTVVKLRYKDHCFAWHPVSGSGVRGTLKLAPLDDRHTEVTLTVASMPPDLRAGVAEMMMPSSSTAQCDVRLLEKHLLESPAAGADPKAGTVTRT